MNRVRIEPMDHPLREGESWWVVHPNYKNCEFIVPSGAAAVCQKGFVDFLPGRAYSIVSNDRENGWLTVHGINGLVEMPYYIFARHFDSEAFIRGTFSIAGKEVEPFDYRPTVPGKPKSLEYFNDGSK